MKRWAILPTYKQPGQLVYLEPPAMSEWGITGYHNLLVIEPRLDVCSAWEPPQCMIYLDLEDKMGDTEVED